MNTDTLEYPEITDAPRADVALDKQDLPVLDLRKIDLTDVALSKFGDWRKETAETKAELDKLALDLSTQARIDEAVSLRHRKINAPLALARKASAGLKSKLTSVSKSVGAELEAIESAWADVATAITPQIEAAQKKIDAEREEKARIERERVAALEAKLAGLSVWIERCKQPGMTAERIAAGIQMLVDSRMGDDWDEFQSRAVARKIEVVDVMRELHAQAVAREAREAEARAEAARLEAQRLENERVAAELKAEAERLAAERRKLAEEAAALAAARAESERLLQLAEARRAALASQEAEDARFRDQERREQAAFDAWADRVCPSGDVESVQLQWEASEDYADLHGIEYQPLIAASAAQGEAENPAPAVVLAEAAQIDSDYIPQAVTDGELKPQTEAEIQAANGPEVEPLPEPATLKLGTICSRLGFTVNASFLQSLGLTPAARDKNAVLYRESRWPEITAALIRHIKHVEATT